MILDYSLIALGLAGGSFLVAVGLDREKTPLQKLLALTLGLVVLGTVVSGLWW